MADTKGIRSPGRDIYSVNFADYLPETLKRDTKMKALAAAVTGQMLGASREIDNVLIYSRIDELPEELIDILAFDMHVDWYDYSYSLETKRNILKNSVKVHKKMGTKYAVITALGNVYGNVGISEWFDYGGNPYFFKVHIDIGVNGFSENTYLDIFRKVQFYKNLRSHCDGLYIRMYGGSAKAKAAAGGGIGAVLKVKPMLKREIQGQGTISAMAAMMQENKMKVKCRKT